MNTILSLRKCNKQFYTTVMYEWEDEFIQKGFVLEQRNILTKRISIFLQKTRKTPHAIRQARSEQKNDILKCNKLAFFMFVSQYAQYYPNKIVPIFIDTRVESFKILIDAIRNIDIAIITNRSACEKAKQIYPEKHLFSIPLWCSNKWKLKVPPPKNIDVLQIGRKNEILHSFMLRFTTSHPSVEYVYKQDCSNNYISTTRGDIGPLESRNDYMNMLRNAKICLVSSPLADSTPDMDFITPRVYEAAMSYCYMLGRFTKNEEFTEVKLDKVVDMVDDYETFSFLLQDYLNRDRFNRCDDYNKFLSENSFEARWQKFTKILNL